MRPKNIIVAVDGPAASGKGTIAKRLATELNLAHMDTGALYRLVGQLVVKSGQDPADEKTATFAAVKLQSIYTPEMSDDPEIRTAEIGQAASQVAQYEGVREALYNLQVDFAHNPPPHRQGAVLDGRDIGTVICPDADVKLYITASTEERARRRTLELQGKGFDVTCEDMLADMRARDERDETRAAAPAKPAEDAVIIDTSEMDAETAFAKAIEIVTIKRESSS